MTTIAHGTDFKVADLSLAAFGRKEIQLAEHEMPGLMATRAEFAAEQPLKGVRDGGPCSRSARQGAGCGFPERLGTHGTTVRAWGDCDLHGCGIVPRDDRA
jgi:adenosylhomocysteinase